MLTDFRRAVLVLISAALLPAAEPLMIPVRVDAPVHSPAYHTFWYGPFSECAFVLDADGDGDVDTAAGRNWYENQSGRWVKHANFCFGADRNDVMGKERIVRFLAGLGALDRLGRRPQTIGGRARSSKAPMTVRRLADA